MQRRLVDAIAQGARVGVAGAGVAGAAEGLGGRRKAAVAGLTEREVDVLTAIGGGLSNAEISARFRISPATVKTHVNHLLAKTGMRDRAQLVGYAFRQDLVR